jgi:hypothetical protein
LVVASVTLGIGPDLGIAAAAPDGWATSGSLAADSVLGPLTSFDSMLGAGVFAAASVGLGWVLGFRHLPLALLGAMVWAAAADAALSVVGDGALGGKPVGVVIAAAAAVALEFGLLRSLPRPPAPGAGAHVGRPPLSGRLA